MLNNLITEFINFLKRLFYLGGGGDDNLLLFLKIIVQFNV